MNKSLPLCHLTLEHSMLNHPKGLHHHGRLWTVSLLATLSLLTLSSCEAETKKADADVPLVTVEVAKLDHDVLRAAGTGEIKARVDSDLSFKVSGRVMERHVGVGDRVKAGQVLATLDPTEQLADIESYKAGVSAQEATLRKSSSILSRRKTLIQTGALSQQEVDSAQQEFLSAQKDLDAAKAELETAQEALEQTELRADADGTITARDVEVGQVVQASTTVFTLAHDGDRDAVFNVQENALSTGANPISLTVSLLSRPEISVPATVREISPTLDRSLGTVRVKLSIANPPPEMTLGAAIIADVVMAQQDRISIPWQAMFSKEGMPAVWVVDKDALTTTLKLVKVERYDADRVILASGIEPGELVIVDGVQFLREQEKVAISKGAAQ
jgi:membrane fusion protein, multidrug efflux system